jgi:hypothetical protein
MTFAAAPLLVEEAVATAATELTAEQIAAQAAEQAAQQAIAQQTAEQAAQQAIAQQTAEQAAQQTAQQVVQQAPPSGIETLAKEVTGTQPTGIEQIFKQAQANNVPMTGQEFLNNSFAGPASAPITPPPVSQLPPFDATQYLNSTMPASVAPPAAPPAPPPAPPPALPAPSTTPVMEAATPAQSTVDYGFSSGIRQSVNAPLDTAEKSRYALGNQTGNYNLAQSVPSPAATATANPEPSGLESLFNQGLDYAKKNPLSTAMGANALVNYLNKPAPYEKPKYKSTFNASAYSGYEPATPNYYRAQYAHGGLADLGGYSDGGRMLKGPGDGMSDNIPATIANKQPARLANEEFVIPADVVSHLGNGSSEAGAKQLYKMMDRVRQARTGNKKQGKQINPEKYLA